ncbi:hypothetical protein NDU88_004963 [Pleurodeles waltl]|uniref:Uncharacterized protein n=1 Tax=Pleurodeles waltl TaxID=8319 RepID=A0AAV7RKN7_PLEWA|nr:hypothetical protein NDU88_004963 [Pleurodeles waltl]
MRIGLILCMDTITHLIRNASYMAKTLSDHCRLITALRWGRQHTRIPTWRLQPTLLQDPPFRKEMADNIESYFKINTGSTSTRATEWDGHKVVTRGMCMTIASGVKRTLTLELRDIERNKRAAEYKIALHTDTSGDTLNLQKQCKEVESRLRKFDYRQYTTRQHMEGDRSSRIVAWLVKGEQKHTPINTIRLNTGTIVNTEILMTPSDNTMILCTGGPPHQRNN